MKCRIVKKGGRFHPEKKRGSGWAPFTREEYDPRDHESFLIPVDFKTEEAAEKFIRREAERNAPPAVVKEFEV